MGNIIITTECICDLPAKLLKTFQIGVIFFTIHTEEYEFMDTKEVSATNILEYMSGNRKRVTSTDPSPEDYKVFFKDRLVNNDDEIIHISAGYHITKACHNAMEGKALLNELGRRVHIVDSKNLSSGMGLVVYKALECKNKGLSCEETLQVLVETIPKINTTFICQNADYLYYNGRVNNFIMNLCHKLSVHPSMKVENGILKLKKLYIGNYDKACERYINSTLKHSEEINKEVGFLTHACGSLERIRFFQLVIEKKRIFEDIVIQPASATISCNCGPNCFGILFIRG